MVHVYLVLENSTNWSFWQYSTMKTSWPCMSTWVCQVRQTARRRFNGSKHQLCTCASPPNKHMWFSFELFSWSTEIYSQSFQICFVMQPFMFAICKFTAVDTPVAIYAGHQLLKYCPRPFMNVCWQKYQDNIAILPSCFHKSCSNVCLHSTNGAHHLWNSVKVAATLMEFHKSADKNVFFGGFLPVFCPVSCFFTENLCMKCLFCKKNRPIWPSLAVEAPVTKFRHV